MKQLFGDYWKGLRVGRLLERGENLHSKPLGKPLGEPISEKQQFISDTFSGLSFDDGDNLNGRVYLVFMQSRRECVNGCGHNSGELWLE